MFDASWEWLALEALKSMDWWNTIGAHQSDCGSPFRMCGRSRRVMPTASVPMALARSMRVMELKQCKAMAHAPLWLARQIGVTQRRQVQYARKRKRHDAMAARAGEQVRTEAVRRKVDAVRREIAGAKRRLESLADADQQRRVRSRGGGDSGDGLTGGGSSAGLAGEAAAADATGILRSSGV